VSTNRSECVGISARFFIQRVERDVTIKLPSAPGLYREAAGAREARSLWEWFGRIAIKKLSRTAALNKNVWPSSIASLNHTLGLLGRVENLILGNIAMRRCYDPTAAHIR